jgi:hypothetical protein
MDRLSQLNLRLTRNASGHYENHFETVAPGIHRALDHAALEHERAELTGTPVPAHPRISEEESKRIDLARAQLSLDHAAALLETDGAGNFLNTHHTAGPFRSVIDHDGLQAAHDRQVARIAALSQEKGLT